MQYLGLGYPLAGTGQKVSYTGTAGTTTAVGSQTYKVRVTVSSDAWIRVGGTAVVNTDTFMFSGSTEYFKCHPGQVVTAVQDSAGGNLTIVEVE